MCNKTPSNILRGQMYYANLDPVIGSEQAGIRPVLIVQNNVGNHYSPTTIVVPITAQTRKNRMPTHIGIPPFFGLPEQSIALLEQIRTIDKQRLDRYIGCLDDEIMDYIDEAIGISVGLNHEYSYTQHTRDEAPDEMLLCLCPTCANQFANSHDHVIQRISTKDADKESCTYCDVRMGYTYRVIRKRKKMADDIY